jgi:hypothetical protein
MPFDLDERYVEEAEATLGARLPSAYRAAMMQRNGGEYEMGYRRWFFYPIFDHSDKKRTVRTSNHIVSETNTSRTYHHFPDDALAIANDDEGNQLVLLQSGDRFGDALYVWDHDTGEVVRIASDLSELTPV